MEGLLVVEPWDPGANEILLSRIAPAKASNKKASKSKAKKTKPSANAISSDADHEAPEELAMVRLRGLVFIRAP